MSEFTTSADSERFEQLNKIYRKSGIALFLGLGLSCRSGLPSWEEFTLRVFQSARNDETTFHQLKSKGLSWPAMLSWALAEVGEEESRRILRSALYDRLDKSFSDGRRGHALKDAVRSTNPSLAAVGAFVCKVNNDL